MSIKKGFKLIAEGMSNLFKMSTSIDTKFSSFEDDEKAIADDWQKVGDDIRKAMGEDIK